MSPEADQTVCTGASENPSENIQVVPCWHTDGSKQQLSLSRTPTLHEMPSEHQTPPQNVTTMTPKQTVLCVSPLCWVSSLTERARGPARVARSGAKETLRAPPGTGGHSERRATLPAGRKGRWKEGFQFSRVVPSTPAHPSPEGRKKLAAMVHIWSRRSMPEQKTFTSCSSGELFKATCNSVLARHFHVVSHEVVPWLCVHSEGGFKRLCVSLSLTYLHVRCANGSSPRRRRNVSPVVPDAYEYEMVTRTALTTVCV